MRLSPSLIDFHKQPLEAGCLITFRPEVYNVVFDDPVSHKIFQINSSRLLKAFTKNDSRVTLIELRTTNRGMIVEYESDNGEVVCFINIEAE